MERAVKILIYIEERVYSLDRVLRLQSALHKGRDHLQEDVRLFMD